MQQTMQLVKSEALRYRIDAEFRLDTALPSFEVTAENGNIVISAPDEVEMLYGVYDFAEKFGGWCFFEPGIDDFDPARKQPLPENGTLIPAKKPLLKRRGFIQEFPFNSETPDLLDWMAKNKLNYLLTWMKYYDELSAELKQAAIDRGIVIESGHHNFDYWIPGAKYGKTNPEFFAEINGKRITPSGNSELLMSEQLCTTNPELRAEIVRRMVEYCADHPEVKVISLMPNDGFGWCECENCSKFYDKNLKGELYSVSRHVYKADRIYHDLLREVAEKLRAVRPDIQMTFCAYVNYCAPSEGFTLEPGMAVHMATYWRCINHALDDPDCETNAHYASDIRKWTAAKHGGDVNIYEYYMGINFYLSLPMIHWEKMFREMRWYHDNGVDGILTQFHIPHWRVYGTNYRLMAQAARGEEAGSSIDRMLQELFGKDAAEAEKLYRAMETTMQDMGKCHIPYPRSLFRRTAVADFERFHAMAQELAAKAPGDNRRKEMVIWTEYLIRFKKFFDRINAGKATIAEADELLNWIHSHKDTRVFVHDRFDMYFDGIKDAIKAGTQWLHFNIDWEDAYVAEHDHTLG
ncbi:MAG: DUF4838 domain-containing protein [Lentisphaerae bacterium]|nr:DUF4838 domain-containing protein [Lentisphaerota bacterium]